MSGSSPLARGLQEGVGVTTAQTRIIPARAGFTASLNGCLGRVADHPRSRGVYARRILPASSVSGSSPLARGLRENPQCHGKNQRDHPRSRGVYGDALLADGLVDGSSPLARGLPAPREKFPRNFRIIPARAGFTPARAARSPGPSDHPRSRGVYHTAASPPSTGPGSSPLARGLHIRDSRQRIRHGIIPARAGFT